jgi:deazaflavin-dependent oxidoreductase (nitroreductase family)
MSVEGFPRKGSAIYLFSKGSRDERKKNLRRWKLLNWVIVPLYKVGVLPLLGVGRILLLLSTKGRRSGIIRTTPLEYRKKDNRIYIFAGRGWKADWYRNLKADPEAVVVRVGFSEYKPTVRFLEDQAQKEEMLKWYVTQFPRASGFLFGWDKKRDDLETSDLSTLVSILEIIELRK